MNATAGPADAGRGGATGIPASSLIGNRWKRIRDLEGRRFRPSNARSHRLRPVVSMSHHIRLCFWLSEHTRRPIPRICIAGHAARLDRRRGTPWRANMVRAATVIMPGLRIDEAPTALGDAA